MAAPREYTVLAKGVFVPLHRVAATVGAYLARGGELPPALAVFDGGGAILAACQALAPEAEAEGAAWPKVPPGTAGMLHLFVTLAQRSGEGAGLALTAHVPGAGELPGVFLALTGCQVVVENRTETSVARLREVALEPEAKFAFAKWAAATFDLPLETLVFCYRD